MAMLGIGSDGQQSDAAPSSGPPPVSPYLFDVKILDQVEFGGVQAVPILGEHAAMLNKQLMVGPEGSGSPVHFHVDALNIAIVGRKRWFLFPPSERFWCTKPALRWMLEDYRALPNPPIEVLQEPGDLVYVPADWGHAVVNLEDSVAVAFEVKWPSEEGFV